MSTLYGPYNDPNSSTTPKVTPWIIPKVTHWITTLPYNPSITASGGTSSHNPGSIVYDPQEYYLTTPLGLITVRADGSVTFPAELDDTVKALVKEISIYLKEHIMKVAREQLYAAVLEYLLTTTDDEGAARFQAVADALALKINVP